MVRTPAFNTNVSTIKNRRINPGPGTKRKNREFSQYSPHVTGKKTIIDIWSSRPQRNPGLIIDETAPLNFPFVAVAYQGYSNIAINKYVVCYAIDGAVWEGFKDALKYIDLIQKFVLQNLLLPLNLMYQIFTAQHTIKMSYPTFCKYVGQIDGNAVVKQARTI
ncbi:MAG: hypothetical protein Q8M98_07055, partial [Candidatus Cloacimonadaceae bacterium]|nr:hypothetical protein [Candidatus Cloacimonadaceae bacterium]